MRRSHKTRHSKCGSCDRHGNMDEETSVCSLSVSWAARFPGWRKFLSEINAADRKQEPSQLLSQWEDILRVWSRRRRGGGNISSVASCVIASPTPLQATKRVWQKEVGGPGYKSLEVCGHQWFVLHLHELWDSFSGLSGWLRERRKWKGQQWWGAFNLGHHCGNLITRRVCVDWFDFTHVNNKP